jgi:hypothetical protein
MPNLNHEIIIKKSKIDKYTGYILCIIMLLFGLYMLFINGQLKGLILILLCTIIFIWHDKESNEGVLLLKISSEGLWTPKHGYKPWHNIQKLKFKYTGGGSSGYRTYLEVYRGDPFNPDEVIDITSMNILKYRLKRELNKFVLVE